MQYIHPDSIGQVVGDHGSFVASRIVYGDPDFSGGIGATPRPACSFYDVVVASGAVAIEDKAVVPAMSTVVGTAPDVRVFNCSFDDNRPLNQIPEIERREKLILLQDLDNFIFANDVIVVFATGNTPAGVKPGSPYPQHIDDPLWQLGPWCRSFNALTCGSTVDRLSGNGFVTNIGWPSPFSKVGPGLCESPKPDFCAHGGNTNDAYRLAPGVGVWGCGSAGRWEDKIGTSYAAPLLAREVAVAFLELQRVCEQGTKPFAATAKAFLALTSTETAFHSSNPNVASRFLGRGVGTSERLRAPNGNSAVLVWQGSIQSPSDVVRVQIPIPLAWAKVAKAPMLRLVVSWDSPVNQAVSELWACRKVNAKLRCSPDAKALLGTRTSHKSYPMIDKIYDLKKLPDGVQVDGDMWMLELAYEQIAEYYPAIQFTPQQRVAFAAELYDADGAYLSPQAAIQALPSAVTMQRLSIHRPSKRQSSSALESDGGGLKRGTGRSHVSR